MILIRWTEETGLSIVGRRHVDSLSLINSPTLSPDIKSNSIRVSLVSRSTSFKRTGESGPDCGQTWMHLVYPHPGWHEHDPTTYLTAIDACIELALRDFIALGHEKSSLKCVGITNQRETTVVWDRQTGKPLTNAIVWPDARNSSTVKELKEKALNIEFRTANGVMVGEEGIRALTGLPISTYFSAVKFAWMNENLQVVREAKEAGTLMLGTVDSWLLYVRLCILHALLLFTDDARATTELYWRSRGRCSHHGLYQRLSHALSKSTFS